MKNTELKVLGHIFDSLDEIDTHRIYSAVHESVNDVKALKNLENENAKINNIVRKCKEWLEVLIRDLEEVNDQSA